MRESVNRIIRDIQMKVPPRSVTYRNFALDFRVENGKVVNDKPWLTLEGLRLVFEKNVVTADE